jgi:hypothetical protein
MGDDDRIIQLMELMRKVEENNQAIKNQKPIYHRELWCDEVDNNPTEVEYI